jgi:hypothetical protein
MHVLLSALATLVAVTSATATTIPVVGAKLIVVDRVAKAKVVFVSRDSNRASIGPAPDATSAGLCGMLGGTWIAGPCP